MRCLENGMQGLKHKRECGYRCELDMETLVCTRGPDFPLARIADRLRCPRCGCRRIAVLFGPPSNVGVLAARRVLAGFDAVDGAHSTASDVPRMVASKRNQL